MSLKKYIAEAEERMHRPDVGDTFAIELEDGTLLETYIMAMEHNAILLDATDRIVSVLAEWNYIGDEAGDVLLEGAYESEDEESAFDRQEHDHEEIEATDAVAQQDSGEYDYEGDMAKDDLYTIIRAARKLTGMLDDNENMPEWVQSKINKAADYVDTAADYIESNKQRAQGVAEGMAGIDDAEPYTIGGAVDKQYVYTVMRDGKSMGIYHSLDDAKLIVANNKRTNKYSKFKIQRKPRSKMAGPVGQLPEQGVAEGQTPESELELLKLRQNAEHGRAPLRRQAATQARIRELEKQIKDKQGMAEGLEKNLSVQQLATISDEALDKAYGYGRSNPGNTFGWQANLMSAAYAKKMIDAGVTDIEKISDAIHKGWNVTAQKFVQNPDQFDDTEKLRQAGKLEAKLAQRAKLMKINYGQLDNEEQEKDRVVARALLKAIKGQQGVAENFADGKKPGRKGLAKRVGVDCRQPVSKLRRIAKSSSGERQRMAHWCANMKAGRK